MPLTRDGQVSRVGQVVAAQHTYARVSSDHAMLDSGNRLMVTFWDGIRCWTETYHTDDIDIHAEPDLSYDDLMACERYGTVRRQMAEVVEMRVQHQHDREAARVIRVADMVDVVKGRKCPKGRYHVGYAGSNDYGRYLHLVALDGSSAQWRYIAEDNCRKVQAVDGADQAWQATLPWTTDATARALATTAASTGLGYYDRSRRAQSYLILADRLEELGLDFEASVIRHLPEITERQAYPWEVDGGTVPAGEGWVSLAVEWVLPGGKKPDASV